MTQTAGKRAVHDTRASIIRLFWSGWKVPEIAKLHKTTCGVVNSVLFARVPK